MDEFQRNFWEDTGGPQDNEQLISFYDDWDPDDHGWQQLFVSRRSIIDVVRVTKCPSTTSTGVQLPHGYNSHSGSGGCSRSTLKLFIECMCIWVLPGYLLHLPINSSDVYKSHGAVGNCCGLEPAQCLQ